MTAPRIDHFTRDTREWRNTHDWHFDADNPWRRYGLSDGQLWSRIAEGKRRD